MKEDGKTSPTYVLACVKYLQLLCPITTLPHFWIAPFHILVFCSNASLTAISLTEALMLQNFIILRSMFCFVTQVED